MKTITAFLITLWLSALPAQAHIDLISPKPMMDGYALEGQALKMAPFGAPFFDVAAAEALEVKSGSEIDVEMDVYVIHPGEILISYTTDMSGADVMPVMKIASMDSVVEHKNMLHIGPAPCPQDNCKPRRYQGAKYKARVKLPDVEGDIILVVRQFMTDKMDQQKDGSVSLKRVYYHQAAKLHLSK